MDANEDQILLGTTIDKKLTLSILIDSLFRNAQYKRINLEISLGRKS